MTGKSTHTRKMTITTEDGMTKNEFNHFIDILFFLPKKITFKTVDQFLNVLEDESKKMRYAGLLSNRKAMKEYLADLSNHIKITKKNGLTIAKLDSFNIFAGLSVSQDPSLIQRKKKEIAKRLIAESASYSDTSEVKVTKISDQIIEVAKKYKKIDDQVFTYLMEYAEIWKKEENGK